MYFDCYVIKEGDTVQDFMVTVAYKIYGDETYLANHRIIDPGKYIFIYTMKGNGIIEVDGTIYKADKNTLIILNAKKSIYYKTLQDNWHIWLFEYKVQEHLLPVNTIISMELTPLDLQFCTYCLKSLKKHNYRQASAYFACVFYNCLEKSIVKNDLEYIYDAASTYIKEHITDCSVADIANEVNVSERQLRNIFYKYANMSPKKYIEFLKIEEARELLETTEILIKDISFKLGFKSPYYFSDFFKKLTGITPNQYRHNPFLEKNE